MFSVLPLGVLAKIYGMAGMSGDISNPLFVPFHWGNMERGHKDLPRAYFQVCGLDPLRDEGAMKD